MFYLLPTKHGIGVELWGQYDDLRNLYDSINNYLLDEDRPSLNNFKNREMVITGFVHEIRKAYEGQRLKRKQSHYFLNEGEFYGAQITWVHFLFALSAIRYNMSYSNTNKFDVGLILQLEFWLERAMINFDETGALDLVSYIEGRIYGANECIYQYMRSVNFEYILLRGGKKAFRKLPGLLKRGEIATTEYNNYKLRLEEDAKRLNCKPSELEINDDEFDYDTIKW